MESQKSGSVLGAYVHLHFIVLLWGFTAILGKLITIPTVEIVFYRTLFASIGLFFLLKYRKLQLKMNWRDMSLAIGTGALIGMHWVAFFGAARVANVSVCLAGMATTSLWTSLIDPIVNKRKIQFYEPILGLLSVIGIVVVFNATIDRFVGFGIAVIAAILAAIFTVINARLVKRHNHFTLTFYEMGAACISIAIFFPFYDAFFVETGLQLVPTQMDIVYLLILSLVCTVYAYSIATKLLHRLTPFAINLTINMEPVYGIIMALFVFGAEEKMGTNFYYGTTIILISVLLYPVARRYFKDRNADPRSLG